MLLAGEPSVDGSGFEIRSAQVIGTLGVDVAERGEERGKIGEDRRSCRRRGDIDNPGERGTAEDQDAGGVAYVAEDEILEAISVHIARTEHVCEGQRA